MKTGVDACPTCGLTYVRGSPDDEREHRRRHRLWAAVAEPKPSPAVRKLNATDGLIAVDWRSRPWLNKAVYERAKLFRREFGYDFVQWYELGPGREFEPDFRARAFLFIADDNAIIAGACAFRWRAWTKAPHEWAMDWVWLAPRFRRRGILTRHWPTFTALFGSGFYLEPPLSDAMEAFARKRGHLRAAGRTVMPPGVAT